MPGQMKFGITGITGLLYTLLPIILLTMLSVMIGLFQWLFP